MKMLTDTKVSFTDEVSVEGDLCAYTTLLDSGAQLLERSRSLPYGGGKGKIYRGVTLIQAGMGNSKDRNYYPEDTLKEAASTGTFEGLTAYVDHPDSVSAEILPERSVRDRAGLYTNTRWVDGRGKNPGRVVGDLQIHDHQSWLVGMIDELVESGYASKIGISINGSGKTRPAKIRLSESSEDVDVNYLEKFLVLRSADLVTEAGAGGGFQQLLESARGTRGQTMSLTKKMIAELQEKATAGDAEAIRLLAEAATASLVEKTAPVAMKKTKGTTKAKAEDSDPGDEDPVEEGNEDSQEEDPDFDPDAELDEAVAEAKGDGDPDYEDDPDEDEDPDEESDAMPSKKRRARESSEPLVTNIHEAEQYLSELRNSDDPRDRMIAKLQERNATLSAELRVRQTADRARKLLRESLIPEDFRPDIVPMLIGKNDAEARRVISYHERLFKAVVANTLQEAGFDGDSIEGAGSRIREGGNSGGDELASVFSDLLPLKADRGNHK